MSASITHAKISIFDGGNGVEVSAEMSVTVRGQVVVHALTSADLGLTPAQVTALQNAVNAVRAKATTVTKADFQIP